MILRPQWFGLPAGDGLTPAQATLPVRIALLSVGLWWFVFTLPILLRVKEPPRLLEPALRERRRRRLEHAARVEVGLAVTNQVDVHGSPDPVSQAGKRRRRSEPDASGVKR